MLLSSFDWDFGVREHNEGWTLLGEEMQGGGRELRPASKPLFLLEDYAAAPEPSSG